jgi:PilZ domain-containing protein
MNSEPVRVERRAGQRFEVNLPLAVLFDGRTFCGFTQDVCSRGVFFYTDAALPQGAWVELILTLPSEITLAESMRVRCRGRVLRTSDPSPQRRNGIAVRFESYQYLSSSEQEAAEFLRVSSGTSGQESPRPWLR